MTAKLGTNLVPVRGDRFEALLQVQAARILAPIRASQHQRREQLPAQPIALIRELIPLADQA